jgi:hypothetical protein
MEINGHDVLAIPRFGKNIINDQQLVRDTDILSSFLLTFMGKTIGEAGINFGAPRDYNSITAKYLQERIN